jgi:hypothetical protein
MSISEIAEYVWAHSHSIRFGKSPTRDGTEFTKPWAKTQKPTLTWNSYGPGWYWFHVTMNYPELHNILKPPTLPENGCDIGALSHRNVNVFGEKLLCQPDSDGSVVVYNGHEASVSARVRAHFALQNNRTGALGLKHFPLGDRVWAVRVFPTPCLAGLEGDTKSRIQLLMNSKTGRCAVETAWRAGFGWPVLCKE